MTLSSTTISSTSSTRRSTALNPEELDLWELCHYAGLTTDPKVFRILVDLLRMDVHPQAVFEVLKTITPKSKYNANKTSSVSDTTEKSASDKTKTVKKAASNDTSSKKAESLRGSSKSATKTQGSSKNLSSASAGEKKSSSSVKNFPAASTKTKSKPLSTKSDPGRK